MSCNCKTEIEKKLKVHFASEGEIISGGLLGYGMVLSATVETKPFMRAEFVAKYKTKLGVEKTKKVKTNMFFSHCPFCGVKL